MPEYNMTTASGKKKPRMACQNITTLKWVYCNLLFMTFMKALMMLAMTMMMVPETISLLDSSEALASGLITVRQMISEKQIPMAKYSTAKIFSSLRKKARILVQKGARLKRIEARAIGMFSRDQV